MSGEDVCVSVCVCLGGAVEELFTWALERETDRQHVGPTEGVS